MFNNKKLDALLEQNRTLLSNSEEILKRLSSEILTENALQDKRIAKIYAYRYLLNREPENQKVVEDNILDWRELRKMFCESSEYKDLHPGAERPYQSLQVEGITYFYNSEDQVIPRSMLGSRVNWAKYDIDNFISIADKACPPPEKTSDTSCKYFLDIGGNIGTTSIYCKLKLKPELRFIAFEPVKENAALLKINSIINGVENDVKVETVALSNDVANHRMIATEPENMGGGFLIDKKDVARLEAEGRKTEPIFETTLDNYLYENNIVGEQIKYIWLDVEGYEPDVLEGAAKLFEKHRIPCCIEFNQRTYRARGCYEKTIKMLQDYFEFFVTCKDAANGETALKPISEIAWLWEKFNHESCDLILL